MAYAMKVLQQRPLQVYQLSTSLDGAAYKDHLDTRMPVSEIISMRTTGRVQADQPQCLFKKQQVGAQDKRAP